MRRYHGYNKSAQENKSKKNSASILDKEINQDKKMR